jgi:sugar (pentulose or hexulose) kinase
MRGCVCILRLRARGLSRSPLPRAQGIIVGLTQFSTRAHIARAMLEAICFQTREVLLAMRADAAACRLHVSLLALRVDGGASSNDLLMQLQADILGTPVVRPLDVETTALGAALAAGVTLELWSGDGLFAPHHQRRGATDFLPSGSEREQEARYARWKSAVARSLCWTREPPAMPVYAREQDLRRDADWARIAAGVALGASAGALLAARWHAARARS